MKKLLFVRSPFKYIKFLYELVYLVLHVRVAFIGAKICVISKINSRVICMKREGAPIILIGVHSDFCEFLLTISRFTVILR
jgi:hypothetical protein